MHRLDKWIPWMIGVVFAGVFVFYAFHATRTFSWIFIPTLATG